MSKYCLVINGPSYYSPFEHLGFECRTDIRLLEEAPQDIALVVFTGGEDVTPAYYGHPNVRSGNNPARDKQEVAAYKLAKAAGIPMAGICRGAQLLCVMAGGHLIQDVSGHTSYHYVNFLNDKGEVEVSPEKISSTHHQMQYPWPIGMDKFDVLAWSTEPRSGHYVYGAKRISRATADKKFTIEPDVVLYKNIGALAMQYHPEWMPKESWGFKYAQHLVNKHLKPLIDARLANAV